MCDCEWNNTQFARDLCVGLPKGTTAEGLDISFATNHIGPFLLTSLLLGQTLHLSCFCFSTWPHQIFFFSVLWFSGILCQTSWRNQLRPASWTSPRRTTGEARWTFRISMARIWHTRWTLCTTTQSSITLSGPMSWLAGCRGQVQDNTAICKHKHRKFLYINPDYPLNWALVFLKIHYTGHWEESWLSNFLFKITFKWFFSPWL